MCERKYFFINRTPYFEIQPFDLFSKIVREQQNPRAKHSFCFFFAALTNLQCLEGKKLGISKSDSLYLPT